MTHRKCPFDEIDGRVVIERPYASSGVTALRKTTAMDISLVKYGRLACLITHCSGCPNFRELSNRPLRSVIALRELPGRTMHLSAGSSNFPGQTLRRC